MRDHDGRKAFHFTNWTLNYNLTEINQNFITKTIASITNTLEKLFFFVIIWVQKIDNVVLNKSPEKTVTVFHWLPIDSTLTSVLDLSTNNTSITIWQQTIFSALITYFSLFICKRLVCQI